MLVAVARSRVTDIFSSLPVTLDVLHKRTSAGTSWLLSLADIASGRFITECEDLAAVIHISARFLAAAV